MSAVADTHAALWYLHDDRRLSPQAGKFLDEVSASGELIFITSITLVEITYLVEKGRLASEERRRVISVLSDPDTPYELAPLDLLVAESIERIDRNQVPDMPDRIIAATALAYGVPLVTRDRKIRATQIMTIW
jgi:PIN domain nuclease of toxin-antitoxin system